MELDRGIFETYWITHSLNVFYVLGRDSDDLAETCTDLDSCGGDSPQKNQESNGDITAVFAVVWKA